VDRPTLQRPAGETAGLTRPTSPAALALPDGSGDLPGDPRALAAGELTPDDLWQELLDEQLLVGFDRPEPIERGRLASGTQVLDPKLLARPVVLTTASATPSVRRVSA